MPSKNPKHTEKFALESAEKHGEIIDEDCVRGVYLMTKQYYTNRMQAIDHKNREKESPEILKKAYFKDQISSTFYQRRLQKMYHKGKITAAEVSVYVNMSKPSVASVGVDSNSNIDLIVEKGWSFHVAKVDFYNNGTGRSNFSDQRSIKEADKLLDKMKASADAEATKQRQGGGEDEDVARRDRRSIGPR